MFTAFIFDTVLPRCMKVTVVDRNKSFRFIGADFVVAAETIMPYFREDFKKAMRCLL
jgi:hypothetical protein